MHFYHSCGDFSIRVTRAACCTFLCACQSVPPHCPLNIRTSLGSGSQGDGKHNVNGNHNASLSMSARWKRTPAEHMLRTRQSTECPTRIICLSRKATLPFGWGDRGSGRLSYLQEFAVVGSRAGIWIQAFLIKEPVPFTWLRLTQEAKNVRNSRQGTVLLFLKLLSISHDLADCLEWDRTELNKHRW